MNTIKHEPANGIQPWVVYWIEGRTETFRASFSTKAAAQQWIARYGDRPAQ